MKVYLVRHAKARGRSKWPGTDELRPLTVRGERQAHGLEARLDKAPLHRVYSSPHLRCRETVEGLATARGLSVETEACLAEGEPVRDALELIRSVGDLPALFCSHGDLVPGLLHALDVGRVDGPAPLSCQKGSMWVLEGRGPRVEKASYVPPFECDRPMTDSTRVAVLDLGSTSFNLLVADATASGEIAPVVRERASPRLGAVIADGPWIPENVCRDAVEAARALRAEADSVGADVFVPVATAAFRDASNGTQLARRIGEAVGVPVRLLSGEEEARAVQRAVRRRIGGSREIQPSLVIDLGGGSLELALDEADCVTWETTLPLGVARLHRELVSSDPMSERDSTGLRDRVRTVLAPHLSALDCCPHRAAVTGGTARAIARLVLAQRGERGARHTQAPQISTAELAELGLRLRDATHDERLRMSTMQRRRADLLPTGALILETLADALGLDSFTVSDWGLREGMILETIGAL
ncbi:MAG: histidine phosphatase family protein [Deltaproteobacteria bacterium]|nr:histidine phosphatase family protein [Deltaproteobacteria bacterium]MBW2416085.1 histidine phosphatase family protein [Deltaproteobacteria bacterium]